MAGPTIYLDNASTSWPKAPGVAEAMAGFLAGGAASPGRGAYRMAMATSAMIDRLRRRLAALIGASDPDRVILGPSATHGLNAAILGLFPPGASAGAARVVTTVLEHNSVRRPLAHLERLGVIDIVRIGSDASGYVDADEVLGAIDERTALVAVLSASNVAGTIQPIERIAEGLRRSGSPALLLVDMSQSAGLIEEQVEKVGIDLAAFPAHKALLGPTGVGVLYVGPRADRLAPTRFGGTGVESESDRMPARLPTRLEPGTPNTVGYAGLLRALEWAAEARTPALEHERSLARRAIEALGAERAVHILGPGPDDPRPRLGLFCFTIDGLDPAEAALALDGSFGIAVRTGLHCAPGAHQALGTLDRGGAIRVSPGPFSTPEDIDALVAGVRSLARA